MSRQPTRLAQQPDAVAASNADAAYRSRRIRPATHPADRARRVRPTANAADRPGGISSANPANRARGIRSSSHDAASCLVLCRGEFLFELLDDFGRNLCALHQVTAGIDDGLAEIGGPQILPQDEHRR